MNGVLEAAKELDQLVPMPWHIQEDDLSGYMCDADGYWIFGGENSEGKVTANEPVMQALIKLTEELKKHLKETKKMLKYCEYDVTLEVTSYQNNDNLAIALTDWSEGWPQPFGVLTVNLDVQLLPNRAFVDVNNMPDAIDFIEKYQLGRPTGAFEVSGYCMYPLYEFDLDRLKKVEISP